MNHQLAYQTVQRTAEGSTRNSERRATRHVQGEDAPLRRAYDLDQGALAQIHETYYSPIYSYISFRVGDTRTVEDLTSEVFTRFLAALRKRFGRPNSIGPWLYGTASRVVKEYYRGKNQWNLVDLDESIATEETGPAEAAEEMWTRGELREAIQKLTEDQQTVLALRFGGNLPIKEVSSLMKRSEGAVKMLQVRAVSALARQMLERE